MVLEPAAPLQRILPHSSLLFFFHVSLLPLSELLFDAGTPIETQQKARPSAPCNTV